MNIKYSEKTLKYSGKELRSLFIYHTFHLQGNALVAFAGPCRVDVNDLVDQEDAKANAPIYSPLMLHFLGEFFGDDLEKTVLRQRMLMAVILDCLRTQSPKTKWVRAGDDLYVGKKKLSVSIATRTPVSTVIHAGLNIENKGTPIPTYSLSMAGINPRELAEEILSKFRDEMLDIHLAACKVRGVP